MPLPLPMPLPHSGGAQSELVSDPQPSNQGAFLTIYRRSGAARHASRNCCGSLRTICRPKVRLTMSLARICR